MTLCELFGQFASRRLRVHDKVKVSLGVRTTRIVESNPQVIIGQIDHRHKGINDLAPELLALQAAAPEAIQPKENLIALQPDVAQLFQFDGPLQILSLGLQIQKPLLCGRGDDSGFDGLHHIVGGLLVFLQFGGQGGKLCRGRLPLLILHHGIRNPLHHVRPEDVVQSGLHDNPLNPLAGHVGLFASPLPPPLLAAVVVMQFAALPGAGEADHVGPAVGALQLPGQQVVPAVLVTAPDAAICFQPLIRRPKGALIDESGHPALDAGVREMIHPDIGLVHQQPEAALVPPPAPAGFQPPAVQIVGDIHKGHPPRSLSEDLPHDLGVCFMDCKAAIRPLAVPERDGAGVHLALLGVVFHAPANILGEGCAVIFSRPLQHGFQQNPLRAVRDGLLCIEDPHPGLLQPELVCGRIVAVPGKTVDLPADHISPVAVSGILQHLLELGAVIGSARQMPIGVDLHHPEVILPGKNLAVRHLLLDGTVPLVMRRVPSVDHGILHIRLKHGRFLFCAHSEQPPAAHRGRLFILR